VCVCVCLCVCVCVCVCVCRALPAVCASVRMQRVRSERKDRCQLPSGEFILRCVSILTRFSSQCKKARTQFIQTS
jgi:hypothetical protein